MRQMRADRVSALAICDRFAIVGNTYYRWVDRLGLPKRQMVNNRIHQPASVRQLAPVRPPPSAPIPWDVELAIKMQHRGTPNRAIARCFGIDQKSCQLRLDRALASSVGQAKQAPITRPCLACDRPFDSMWIGNRVCSDCKKRDDRQYSSADHGVASGIRVSA